MDQKDERRETDPRYGVPDSIPDDCLVTDEGFATASQLSHLKIKGFMHLWQLLDGKVKSFTNGIELTLLEQMAGFSHIDYFTLMYELQWKSQPDKKLIDGFYWVNHQTRTGGYFPCKEWTEEAEDFLRQRGVVE